MSLTVEVAGFGLCQAMTPYSVMVICVQQETFQAWTVYRRYGSFLTLMDQLRVLHPTVPDVPEFNPDNLSIANLDNCRYAINNWLRYIASDPLILRTQSMYQFLCVDANMPPPCLEVHWRNRVKSSIDETDSEKAYRNYQEDDDDRHDDGALGCAGRIDGEWDDDDEEEFNSDADNHTHRNQQLHASQLHHMQQQQQQHSHQSQHRNQSLKIHTTYTTHTDGSQHHQQQHHHQLLQQQQQQQHDSHPSPTHRPSQHRTNNLKGASSGNAGSQFQNDFDADDDKLEMQSLKAVEAEYLYRKVDDGTGKALSDVSAEKKKISLEAFQIIKVIGKGSFGKVFLVRDKANKTVHALKVLKKEYIIRKNQVEHTKTERSVLGYVHHPFIVGLTMAFQTADKLFFVLDYCAGGELFFHLGKVGRFPEERAMFYSAQITLALEHVHSLDIIYRDLKPENVLLDHLGNVRLTDFGLSKEGVRHHSLGATSFCGTPEYIAPEVLLRQGHGRAVDWWSLGALLFEMISGFPPFYSRNRELMFEKIMRAELTFPTFMTQNARSLLSQLLQRDPKERLGSGDGDAWEVKEHIFFWDIDFDSLASGRIIPPWTPCVAGSIDTSQFDLEFTSMQPIVSPDLMPSHLASKSLERTFAGFSFVNDSDALHRTSLGAR